MKMTKVDTPVEGVILKGDLTIPEKPTGLITFSHGSGSSRLSPHNRICVRLVQKNLYCLHIETDKEHIK